MEFTLASSLFYKNRESQEISSYVIWCSFTQTVEKSSKKVTGFLETRCMTYCLPIQSNHYDYLSDYPIGSSGFICFVWSILSPLLSGVFSPSVAFLTDTETITDKSVIIRVSEMSSLFPCPSSNLSLKFQWKIQKSLSAFYEIIKSVENAFDDVLQTIQSLSLWSSLRIPPWELWLYPPFIKDVTFPFSFLSIVPTTSSPQSLVFHEYSEPHKITSVLPVWCT